MFISEIHANGFRCFGTANTLTLKLRRGLNILVGPNDAGKTAIIDAPRYVLWTRGDEYVRLDASDFHVDEKGDRASDLLIRCTFDGLAPDEESRFLEWCTNENGTLRLHVSLRASRRKLSGGGDTVITQHRAGEAAEGLPIEGDLREYLKSTYLRPLRDAERELRSGRRSRLSRILGAMPIMAQQAVAAKEGEQPTLVDTMKAADQTVESNRGIKDVQSAVNSTFLDKLSFKDDPLIATLGLGAKGHFDQILERLELYLNPPGDRTDRVVRGLGYNNLLFMAAELLLLQSHPEQIPFLLVEEPEAHLHPQHQTLFMQVLNEKTSLPSKKDSAQPVQVLLSTHSPQLAAGADLETLTMVVGAHVYSLCEGETELDREDYAFLRRFLDATKANLFFARGLIIVEGDAENILLPAIAKKLGRPLGRHGVSIVNVGHRGLFRYSRIFQRADRSSMPVPVALVPDRDIPPDEARDLVGTRKTESMFTADEKKEQAARIVEDAGGCVQVFPSEQWTLEFDLARKEGFVVLVHQAVKLARQPRQQKAEALEAATKEVGDWRAESKSVDVIATLVFEPLFKKLVSKAQVAEQLAQLIEDLQDEPAIFRQRVPGYLTRAIDYATGLSLAEKLSSEESAAPMPKVGDQ